MKRQAIQSKTHMLATDLDQTFVGIQQETEALLELFEQSLNDIALVYVTGRHAQSVQELIEQESLPYPDLVISDVGTKIWHMPGWKIDETWRSKMESGWNPDSIKKIALDFPGLRPQLLPDDSRVSFTVEGDHELVKHFELRLRDKGVACQIIFSSNRDVDVLPVGAGKGNALDFVLKNYSTPTLQLLVAGDSGNDIDMLSREWLSVIVGNAHDDLKAIPDRVNLYRATQHCAAGIREAWEHFYGKQTIPINKEKAE